MAQIPTGLQVHKGKYSSTSLNFSPPIVQHSSPEITSVVNLFFFNFYLFFLLSLRHAEVSGPGIKPAPHQ